MNYKAIPQILGTALVLVAAGCASTTPVVTAPVGPSPNSQTTQDSTGQLEVFTAVVGFTTGNPAWYLHTDYYLCDQRGMPLQRVDNVTNYFAMEPRMLTLPPGNYIVRAVAKDHVRVDVPVVVDAGRTTSVHLDHDWWPAGDIPKSDLVTLPSGNPVGWSVENAK